MLSFNEVYSETHCVWAPCTFQITDCLSLITPYVKYHMKRGNHKIDCPNYGLVQ